MLQVVDRTTRQVGSVYRHSLLCADALCVPHISAKPNPESDLKKEARVLSPSDRRAFSTFESNVVKLENFQRRMDACLGLPQQRRTQRVRAGWLCLALSFWHALGL